MRLVLYLARVEIGQCSIANQLLCDIIYTDLQMHMAALLRVSICAFIVHLVKLRCLGDGLSFLSMGYMKAKPLTKVDRLTNELSSYYQL